MFKITKYYKCEKHASSPGLEPGSLEYRSNKLHLFKGEYIIMKISLESKIRNLINPVLNNNLFPFLSRSDSGTAISVKAGMWSLWYSTNPRKDHTCFLMVTHGVFCTFSRLSLQGVTTSPPI